MPLQRAYNRRPSPRTAPPFLKGPGRFLAHYVYRRRLSFICLAIMVVAASSCAVAVQYVMKLLVDAMAGPRDSGLAETALMVFIIFIAVESILWRLSGWFGCRTTLAIGVDMRLDLFEFLSGQPMRYFSDNPAGALGQRITSTAGNFGALANTIVWRIVPPSVDFLGAMVVFSIVDWRMAIALAASVLVITLGLIIFGEHGRRHHREYAAHASDACGDLVDIITNMWCVKAFSAQRNEQRRLARIFRREEAAQRTSWMYTEKARLIHDIALWLMAGGMLTWAVQLWRTDSISPGDVVVVSALTFRILHGSRDMALSLVEMVQQFGFIEDTLHVIGQPQTVVDLPGAPALEAQKGAIVFRGVSFGYEDTRDAVHNIDFSIEPGQKVGIVGPSGAGKSTLVHLLQRLYDVHTGEILIDGQNIARIRQDSLREKLAVVPQELVLFHRSVMENIRIARPGARDDEVFAVARAAQCDLFISRLANGYHTLVGERGVKLSGGQRQRIGIARAFLKTSPIIVLDEATSALDTESELKIQNAIVEFRDRTVIAVAHRLSTLNNFDRILVMEHGSIVEDGTAAELRARAGLFERMWRLQANGLALDRAA
ncbi:ABC transporter ATP-binding protein [Pseudaminobacter sp. 19-2017]|uniref:ABC transporter ATP-binding protein n=1 Tax=Pseudaminobacter soli (ex Zhang et al. 2022) TaxID=2831468 RepID=A0A942IBB7_9HYPH|nr:ABC transporter ATP-binding protein [Pseudaminobacter soli]MBS3652145.1 ABC transporter ATP-binding protein [Pseudaminobacter soli]